MEEHEHEERELTSHMERALATAIATTASLIEAYMRRQARRRTEPVAKQDATDGADEQAEVAQQARAELAVRRDDGETWRHASYDKLNDRIMEDAGIDPRTVGTAAADRSWTRSASGTDILDAYDAADRWAGRSTVAESMRDNIAAELASYGLDLDQLLGQPREVAAEQITDARAQWWEANRDTPTTEQQTTPQLEAGTAVGAGAERGDAQSVGEAFREDYTARMAALGLDADELAAMPRSEALDAITTAQNASNGRTDGENRRDGEAVTRLVDAGRFADNDMGDAATRSAEAAGTGDRLSAQAAPSRAERIAEYAGTTPTGQAAALSAIDHPTNPRDAVRGPRKDTSRPRAGAGVDASRDRGRGGR